MGFRDWIASNQELVVSILKIGGIVLAAGAAISVLGTVFGVLGTILSFVGGVIGAVVAVIGFLLSPIGLAVAAVVTLGAAFLYICGFGDLLGNLLDTFQATMGGIFNAIKAGDLGLAARIAWDGLKVIWLQSTGWVSKTWHNFWNALIDVALGMWALLMVGLSEGWYGIKVGWAEAIGFIRKLWTDMKMVAVIAWNSVTGAIINAVATAWNALADLINGASDALDKIGAGFGHVGKMDTVDIGAKNKQATDEADAEKAAISKDTQDTESKAKQEATARDKETLDAFQKGLDKRNAEQAAREKKNADEIAAAQKDLTDANKQAAEEAKATQDRAQKATAKAPEFDPSKYKDKFNAAGMALEEAKVSVAGTFNAEAADRMGMGSAADRTAKATEQTAENTKKLLNKVGQNELVFQ